MDEVIRVVDGAEARLTLAQFLGQVTPELRSLEKMSVGSNSVLNVLNPEALVKAIPLQQQPAPPGPPAAPMYPAPGAVLPAPQPVAPPPASAPVVVSPNPASPQLEFDFSYNIVKDLLEQVKELNNKVDKLTLLVKEQAPRPQKKI